MWIRTIKQTRWEPAEHILMQEPNEGRNEFIQQMVDDELFYESITVIDFFTDEDIELEIESYFNSKEIALLSILWDIQLDWTVKQVEFMLNNMEVLR